jgi:hypothetical protein
MPMRTHGDCLSQPIRRTIPSWLALLIADVAEAALHTDRVAAARELLAQVEDLAGARPAVWIELNLRHARALLARDNAQAQRRFDDALGTDLGRWPFHRARLLLTHGEWLRRQRRIADSRTPLRAARDLFDTLGCMTWSERARRELCASGESSRRVQGRRRWFLRDAEPSPFEPRARVSHAAGRAHRPVPYAHVCPRLEMTEPRRAYRA